MKKIRRLLVFISVLFAACIAVLGVYSALDSDFLYVIGVKLNNEVLFSGERMGLFFSSLLMLAVIVAILLTIPKKNKGKEAIRITNAGGTVSISAQTIETLARLEAQNAENIYDIRTNVMDIDNKPIIEIRVKVPPTVSIPEISMQLQENIRKKIMDTTGTDIENVKILIDGIVDSDKK